MKNVRIWFTKTGTARYISHLDLARCMSRALRLARLPVWYTEGFSPRISMGFAVPLSLGFESPREAVDIRLLEDVETADLLQRLNAGLPDGIRAFDVTEPVQAANDIVFADYRMTFTGLPGAADILRELLAKPEIPVIKRTKKGDKTVDIRPHFEGAAVEETAPDACTLRCILPAGNNGGINPMLLLEPLHAQEIRPQVHVERLCLLDGEKKPFV